LSLRSISSAACALVAVFGVQSLRAAEAEPRLVVDLEYRADPTLRDCPGEAEFRNSIEEQVGYEPFQPGARHRLLASFGWAQPGIRGTLVWQDASGQVRGERELHLEAEDCPAFARMLGFAIVVQLDLFNQEPELAEPSPSASVDEVNTGDPPTAPVGADEASLGEDATDPGSTGGAGWQLAVGAGPIAGIGFTSRPAVGGRVFVSARREEFAAEIGGEASVPSLGTPVDEAGFQERLILGSLAGCVANTHLSGCLVGKTGVLQVRGFGLDVSRSSSGLVAQLGPRFSVSQRLGRSWAAALRIELLAALIPRGVLLDREEVWRTPAAGVSIGVDVSAVVRDYSQPARTIRSDR
jgi:hypothetical protein